MNETDLRDALQQHAESFRPDPGWLSRTPARRTRWPRWIAVSSPVLASAAAVVAIFLVPSGVSERQTREHSTVATDGPSRPLATIQLARYAAPAGGVMPRRLQRHLTCMRSHGYDLPDPTWTGHGWLLRVDDVPELGLGTPQWRRTLFYTCGLARPPGHLALPDSPGTRNLPDPGIDPRLGQPWPRLR